MKDLILGLLIGAILGLWFGVNLGKEQPLFTNPFVKESKMQELGRTMEQVGQDVGEKSKDLYQDTKDAVNEALK
jgi:gas vesicle protein